jgi:hypothetical protein
MYFNDSHQLSVGIIEKQFSSEIDRMGSFKRTSFQSVVDDDDDDGRMMYDYAYQRALYTASLT